MVQARDLILGAEDRVVIGGVHRRLLDLHLRPVGIEFFGDDQRQHGVDALPHFGRRRHDGDRAVAPDGDIGVEFSGRALRQRLDAVHRRREGKGERQAGGASEHLAAANAALCARFLSIMFMAQASSARRVRWR